MMKYLHRIQPVDLKSAERQYHLLVAALGYEQRARCVSEVFSPRCNLKVAFGFDQQQCLSFEENRKWFATNNFTTIVTTNKDFSPALRSFLLEKVSSIRHIRLLVDISSQSRYRIATLLTELLSLPIDVVIHVDFAYSLSAFVDAPTQAFPNSHVGPVSEHFCGWWGEPERPSCAVVGLGYEQDRALGAVEHMEASETWAFLPESEIPEYRQALRDANSTLLESLPEKRLVTYRVQQPFDTFVNLESLIYGLSRTKNPILLPMGPKIFALISLMVGILHRETAVWRVSASVQENPVDRKATGQICGLSAIISNNPSADVTELMAEPELETV
jgi:hypothetical protein